jgi:hypothetical protein
MNFIVYLANCSTCIPIRFLGNNSLTGGLPSSIGPSIKYLYVCPVPFSFKEKIRKMFIYNIFPCYFYVETFPTTTSQETFLLGLVIICNCKY